MEYRQSVFTRLYPGEQFQNFSPFFEDDEQDVSIGLLGTDGTGEIHIPDEVHAAAADLVENVINAKLSERSNQ